jgi:hypothetical protein
MAEDVYAGIPMVDVTAPEVVEIRIRWDGQVVWVNVDDICRFRACQVKLVILEDDRNAAGDEKL